jgi:hypothetical protein
MAIANPQQLNNADRMAVRPILVPRITAVVANYALYILGGGKNADPNVAHLKEWATTAIRNAGTIAEQASWHVINQTSFLNGGSSIEDAELQGIIEAAINSYFVTPLT